MKARPLAILLFLLAVAALALGMTGEAKAFTDEPCYGVNEAYCAPTAMSQTVSGWTVTLNGVTPDAVAGWYVWNYSFTNPKGGLTGSNFVAFLIPDCCHGDDKILVDTTKSNPSNFSVSAVGAGEPTLGFGRYNQQAFVLKGTPDNTGNWKIVTNTNYMTRSSIIIKYGNNVFQFEMAVPGCPPAPTPSPLGGRTHSECISMGQETDAPFTLPDVPGVVFPADSDDVSFYIVRNMDQDGCVSAIWACDSLYCPDCNTDQGCLGSFGCELITGDPQAITTILEASLLRSCPDENFKIETGSPFYRYTWNSGGVTYVKCLDLATSKWVDNCCCNKTCTCP